MADAAPASGTSAAGSQPAAGAPAGTESGNGQATGAGGQVQTPAAGGQPNTGDGKQTPQGNQPAEITAKDLTLPQGFEPAAAEQVAGLAKEMGWSKEQAQKFLDRATSPEAVKAHQDAQAKQAKAWEDAVAADPAFGGEKLAETKVHAKRAIDAMVKVGELTEADITYLRDTGTGNHPILVKLAARLGRALGEDGFGGHNAGGTPSKKTDAELFYGKAS